MGPATVASLGLPATPAPRAAFPALKPAPAPTAPTHFEGPALRQAPADVTRGAHLLAERLQSAQRRLDQVLSLAASGRSFTAGQLLSLQMGAFQATHTIDLSSRLVEKVTSGARQLLQTQL